MKLTLFAGILGLFLMLLTMILSGTTYSAELRVGTEYIYPTAYQVIGGQIQTTPGGRAGMVQEVVVVPTAFATREVGVVFSVEATVSSMNHDAKVLASLEPRNKNGNTELMIAATMGNLDEVRNLLSRGAMVNTRNSFGSTALMGAAAGGYKEIVQSLLMKNARTDIKARNGSTALMFAAKNGHLDVVGQLLAAGANANEITGEGVTALMYAVQGGYSGVVQKLLKGGAKSDRADRHGTTAKALALKNNDRDILILLTRGVGSR